MNISRNPRFPTSAAILILPNNKAQDTKYILLLLSKQNTNKMAPMERIEGVATL
jgi:hypothetical protein